MQSVICRQTYQYANWITSIRNTQRVFKIAGPTTMTAKSNCHLVDIQPTALPMDCVESLGCLYRGLRVDCLDCVDGVDCVECLNCGLWRLSELWIMTTVWTDDCVDCLDCGLCRLSGLWTVSTVWTVDCVESLECLDCGLCGLSGLQTVSTVWTVDCVDCLDCELSTTVGTVDCIECLVCELCRLSERCWVSVLTEASVGTWRDGRQDKDCESCIRCRRRILTEVRKRIFPKGTRDVVRRDFQFWRRPPTPGTRVLI